jgi:hypothetical protein
MGEDTFSEEADLAAGLLATAGLGDATGVRAWVALPVVFATGLETDFSTALAVGLVATLAAGLGMDFSATTAAGLEDLTADFTGVMTTGLGAATAFTADFAGDLVAALASFTGVAAGLVTVFALTETALDLGSFPVLAFTWSLLVELVRLSSATRWASTDTFGGLLCWVSPARECTGFTSGKPNSCKIETIIPLPTMIHLPAIDLV